MLRTTSDPYFGGLDSHVGAEATAHGATDSITIPDAQLLFGGEYKRAGTDLILSNHNHEFVVHDYFRNGNKPTLLSPDGGRVTADIVEALTGHGDYAQAGAPAQTAPTVVGRVVKFDGYVTVIRNGVAVSLHVGDGVLKGDVLQTGTGTMAVTFNDGSTLTLTENSRLAVNDFVYQANGTANSEILDLVRGSLSFVSGEVAHSGGHMNITTPVATMGIRGTVGTVSNGDDGTVHFSIVESATGAVLLDSKGNVFATITANGPDITVHFQNAQLVAQETQKSPQEVAQQQAILQNILSTQAVGQQILQQFFNQQPNPNPQSTDTQHTQINIDITKTASDNGPPTGPINTGNNPPPQDNPPVVHVVVTDSSNNHVILDDHIQQPPPPPPPASNSAPTLDLAPIITEVPIPNPLPDGADQAAVQEIAPAMSHDGRWVVFFSDEINPDSNGNNNNNHDKGDVLLYDRLTGVTKVLTDYAHIPLGATRPIDEHFSGFSISPDGSFAVFRGEYPSGNPGQGPSTISHIYVYDRAADVPGHASDSVHLLTNPNDGNTPFTVNDEPRIGGGHIVFASDDFGNNSGPPIRHIYVTDLDGQIQTNITTQDLISPPVHPANSEVNLEQADISGNGRYLTFWAVPHETNTTDFTPVGDATLYTYDRLTHLSQVIATTTATDDDWWASMSDDGNKVVFQSDSNALDTQAGGNPNCHMDIFVWDRSTGDITGITENATVHSDGASFRASISGAGNDIIFASDATNLVPGDTNGLGDTFVYNVPHNAFRLISAASDGTQGNGDSTLGADISGGHYFQGAFVSFGSTADNLVPGDNNGTSDVFVVDRTGGIIGSVTEDDTTPAFAGAPLTGFLSTHGAFNFSDVDLSDTHRVSVTGFASDTSMAPGFTVPSGGLGTFTPTVVETAGSGQGQVAWTFTVDNALVQGLNGDQRVSEVYTVQVDDGHGGVVTQDVTIVIGGTPDAPEIRGPAQEFAQTPADSNSYDKQGQIAFSDPDLTDSHHVQVFFDAAASSSWAQLNFVPSYNADDTVITSGFGTFTATQISSATDSTSGRIGSVDWHFNLDSQLPSGTEIVFDIHVIDGAGQDAVQEVVVHSPGLGTWINSSGGDWGTIDNWYNHTTPGTADDVFITQPVGYTVTFDGNSNSTTIVENLTIGNGVTFDVTHNGSLSLDNDLTNGGVIDVKDAHFIADQNGINTGTMTVEGTGDVISSTLDISGSLANSGTVAVGAHGEAGFGSVAGSGLLAINGGALALGTATTASADTVDTNNIAFGLADGTLLLSGHGKVTGNISGFGPGDTIGFIDEQVTVDSYHDNGNHTGVLEVHLHGLDSSGDSDLYLLLNGDYVPADFVTQFDGLNTLLYDEPPGNVQLSTNGFWTNAAGGDWGTASNWQNNVVPGTGDDIVLNSPAGHTVTFNGATDGIPGFGLAQVGGLSVGANVAFDVINRGDIFFDGSLGNLGTIDVADAAVSFNAAGTNTNTDLVTVEGTTGVISSTFDMDNGTLANSGTVDAKARGWATIRSVTGSGLLKVDGGVIELGGADVTSAQTIDSNEILFVAAGGLLMLDGQGQVSGHISGFGASDNVSFIDEQVTGTNYDSGTGVLQLHLHSLDDLGDHDLSLTFDGMSGGTFTAQFDGLDSLLYFNPTVATVTIEPGAGQWKNPNSGDWGTVGNWGDGSVPGAFDQINLGNPTYDTQSGTYTVTFNGAIDGQSGFASASSLTVAAGVTFDLTHHGSLFFSKDLHNNGLIDVLDSGLSIADGGTNTGTIIVHGTSGFISSSASIGGALANSGAVIAGAHGEASFGSVTGSGFMVIDDGAIDISGADNNDLNFSTADSGALLLGDAVHFTGHISGFAAADSFGGIPTAPSIDLTNVNATVATYTDNGDHSGVLEITQGVNHIDLSFFGDYTTANFALQPDGLGGTLITDQGPVISAANGSVADNGNGTSTLSRLQILDEFESGQFKFDATASDGTLTLVDNPGPGASTLSVTDALSNISAKLDHGIIYTPNSPASSTDSLLLKITDEGRGSTNGAITELNFVFSASGQSGVTLNSTAGNDVLSGTSGADTFVFHRLASGGSSVTGHDSITNFDVTEDFLNLDQSVFGSVAKILASAQTDAHGDTTIYGAANSTITLNHITTADLSQHQSHILMV